MYNSTFLTFINLKPDIHKCAKLCKWQLVSQWHVLQFSSSSQSICERVSSQSICQSLQPVYWSSSLTWSWAACLSRRGNLFTLWLAARRLMWRGTCCICRLLPLTVRAACSMAVISRTRLSMNSTMFNSTYNTHLTLNEFHHVQLYTQQHTLDSQWTPPCSTLHTTTHT